MHSVGREFTFFHTVSKGKLDEGLGMRLEQT